MVRMLLGQGLNAVWLVPVTAGAAWLLVKVSGLRAAPEYRVRLGARVVGLARFAGSMVRVAPVVAQKHLQRAQAK